MEHNRKQKLLVIVALIVGIASLSIGFAAFSVSLNISSSASVTPNSDTFSVKFSTSKDSLVEGAVVPSNNAYNLVTTNGVINNGATPMISGLSTIFTEPGQVAVYTVYARNEGEYTAYLNNVNFIGDKVCTAEAGTTDSLVQSACNDIHVRVIVEGSLYNETTPITGHSLEKNTADTILIVLEYVGSGARADGAFKITFPDIALVYSTIDDSSIQPVLPEKLIRLESGDLNTPGSVVAIGNEKFYVIGQEDGFVNLLAMYNLYVGNSVDSGQFAKPLVNPTGIQNKDAIGYNEDSDSGMEIFPVIGTTAFSSASQKGTNYSDYNGSIVEGYVNNYALYLTGLGANINKARLITIDELNSIGCSSNSWTCKDAPDFVYRTSYWTGSSFDTIYIWAVYSDARFLNGVYYALDNAVGVRPVIEISVSEF